MSDKVTYYGAPPDQNFHQTGTYSNLNRPPDRRRPVLRRILALILILILLFLVFESPLLPLLNNSMGPYLTYPEEANFTMERTVTLSGSGTYTVDYAEPENITNAQQVVSISFTRQPSRETRYGVKWDVWQGNLGAFNERQTIVMTYTLHTYTLVWNMDSSGTVSQIPQDIKSTYTGDEWALKPDDTSLGTSDRDGDGRADVMIEPTAPQISSLSHNLTFDKPDVYSQVKSVYNYMHHNFRYSTQAEMQQVQQQYGGLPKHSLATLRDGWGDCDEQSMLLISLLRAAGIPARLELGALYDPSTDTWGGHAWAQVYIPGDNGDGGWYNIDIVNSEFLFRDCNRMTTWVDDGNGDHLDDYYHIYTGSSSISFDEKLGPVSYKPSGQVKIPYGDSQAIPGFGTLMIPLAIASVIALRKRKR